VTATPTALAGWAQTISDLEQVARQLAAAREVALDTEGDSLHHYPARLALIQVADDRGAAWLVDPLAIENIAPLGSIFADARIATVLHAADNDLAHLKGRYGFTFASIFDTSLAARFLGAPALGLDVLLRDYLGVELPPSRQKDDWSARPLTPAQERYAVADVEYLLPLKDRLVEALARAGRLAWVQEECEALAAQPAPDSSVDADAYASLKGARDLSARGLAALRELHAARERLAIETDRPPFKVLANETLIQLAGVLPRDATELGQIPGLTPRAVARWGGAILAALDRALALPEAELPALARRPRPPVKAAVRRRIETLRAWRSDAAPRFGLEPGVLLPNRLIGAVAEAAPRDVEALTRVDGLRRWRVETFGHELVAALAPPAGIL
jgi:ribonuclease D